MSERFIHLCQAHQVLEVARAYYGGQKDLVVLVVDPGLLESELRFEAPSHLSNENPATPENFFGLFPHVYGPLNASAIIDVVDLDRFSAQPIHPDTADLLRHYRFDRLPVEGTLFKSSWRSEREINVDERNHGPAGTAMIGLYAENPESLSCFHRLQLDELWHFYSGDPLMLYLLYPDGSDREIIMGSNHSQGQVIQYVIPAGTWQAGCLVPGGRYALFGCTMAPGFTGDCFEAAVASELVLHYPSKASIIQRLSINGQQRRMPKGFAP